MEPIRVVRGTGEGPTELAAYDAALADAGVADYNLLRLSSVVPAGAPLTVTGTAPDLGPAGEGLAVVEARSRGADQASAVLGWARAEDGRGIVYEEGASEPIETVRDRVATGLDAGVGLREWEAAERRTLGAEATADAAAAVAAVVVAAYGSTDPLL